VAPDAPRVRAPQVQTRLDRLSIGTSRPRGVAAYTHAVVRKTVTILFADVTGSSV
jgi:class 3 adenylate cyclase